MLNQDDYKRFTILYVDDEVDALTGLSFALGDTFTILTANNAADGLKILEQQKEQIGVLMTDQRMPEETGVEFLEKARVVSPRTIRILATAYSDITAAIDAVNTGAIYKYLTKPWDVRELEFTLKRALEFFQLQRERDELLNEKLSVTYSMMIADRIMMLGLIGQQLNATWRNAPDAVRSYLEYVGNGLRRDSIGIEDLTQASVLDRFYATAKADANVLADVLRGLPVDDGELSEMDIVPSAKAAAQTAGLEVALPSQCANLPGNQKLTEFLFLSIWNALLELEATDCQLRCENPNEFSVRGKIGPDCAKARALFNPFGTGPQNDSKSAGAQLLAGFVLAYHMGWVISDGGLSEEIFQMSFDLSAQNHPASGVGLDSVLFNETLWERVLD